MKESKTRVGRSAMADKPGKWRPIQIAQLNTDKMHRSDSSTATSERDSANQADEKKTTGRSTAIKVKDQSRSIKCKTCGTMDCFEHVDEGQHEDENLGPPTICGNCRAINRFTRKAATLCTRCGCRYVYKTRSTNVQFYSGR